MATKSPAKRAYNSSRRSLQAAQTRDEVIRAATARFSATGWAGTTLAAIADAAGVSVETIYNGFGSKKGLLRAAMEAAVVGDTEPIPFVERPEFLDLGTGTLDERVARGAAVVANTHARSAGVWQAIVEASSADEEVDAWRHELEKYRRVDTGRSLERVLGHPVDDQLVSMFWVLYSPEAYLKLVHDSGLSPDEYQALLVDASKRLAGVAPITGPSATAAGKRVRSTS
jgi:AcrR family transcriptional regulator